MEDSQQIILRHLEYMALEGSAADTISMRRRTLRALARDLPVPLLDATRDDLIAWRASLAVGPDSVRQYVSRVRAFYTWCLEEQIIRTTPARRIPVPPPTRRHPRPIPEDALMSVLATAPRRVRPMIVLMGWAGLRCKEVAFLRGEDLALGDRPGIHVSELAAKGRSSGFVPVSRWAAGELAVLPRRGWCFPRLDGDGRPALPAGHISASRVSSVVNAHLHDSGYADTAHAGRHRFLTEAQRRGKNLRITQDLARHRSPESTSGYAAVTDEDARGVVELLPVPPRLRAAG